MHLPLIFRMLKDPELDSVVYLMREHTFGRIYENVWIDRLDRVAAWLPFAIGLIGLSMGIGYCLKNCSGHSGMSPFEGSVLFVPIAVAALFVMLHRRGNYFIKLGGMGLVVGVMGALFGGFIHAFQIMREYNFWVQSGMPDQNPASGILLFGYAGLTLILLFVVGCYVKSEKETGE